MVGVARWEVDYASFLLMNVHHKEINLTNNLDPGTGTGPDGGVEANVM